MDLTYTWRDSGAEKLTLSNCCPLAAQIGPHDRNGGHAVHGVLKYTSDQSLLQIALSPLQTHQLSQHTSDNLPGKRFSSAVADTSCELYIIDRHDLHVKLGARLSDLLWEVMPVDGGPLDNDEDILLHLKKERTWQKYKCDLVKHVLECRRTR